MFENGQKCFTFKENVRDCTKPKNRKYRHDIVECTVQSVSYDQKFVLFTWHPYQDKPWAEYSKIELGKVFVSAEAAQNHLEEQKQIKKADLPRAGDLVGFMNYEPIDEMNRGYVFRTSYVVKSGETSVKVVSISPTAGLTQTESLKGLIVLQRAAPKVSKSKKKVAKND